MCASTHGGGPREGVIFSKMVLSRQMPEGSHVSMTMLARVRAEGSCNPLSVNRAWDAAVVHQPSRDWESLEPQSCYFQE